jgi:CubicO group peptidase (beta-lactamase class C family)
MSMHLDLPGATHLARLALVAASCLVAAGLSLAPAAQAAKLLVKPSAVEAVTPPEGDPASPKVQLQTSKTVKMGLKSTLEVTAASGDLERWETAVLIDTRRKVFFQWSTGKGSYDGAMWQVGDKGSDVPMASGQVGAGPFAAGKQYRFVIAFKTLLPVIPPSQPRQMWVRVVPQSNGQALVASSAVEVGYARPRATPGQAPVFAFDHGLFAYNLTAQLDGKTAGYAYAIYQGETLKKSGAGGFAVRSTVPMTADRRMRTGSSSKTITAVAAVRAIEIMKARGEAVSIDSPISPYLPSDWVLGPHIAEMTIKDLLRHTSGLVLTGGNYALLRQIVADGATESDWAARNDTHYCNCNFSLFRIMIPYMVDGRAGMERSDDPGLQAEIQALQADLQTASPGQKAAIMAQIKALLAQNPMPAGTLATRTSQRYVSFVQNEVLARIGLGNVWINPRGPAETIHYYNVNDPSKVYTGAPDEEALGVAGSDFWFMSAKELAKFAAGMRAGKIVSPGSYQLMVANRLGMWKHSTAGGQAWGHNGLFVVGDAGGWAMWMTLPDGVSAAILFNSTHFKESGRQVVSDANGFPVSVARAETIVQNAYNAAFAMEQVQP